MSKLSEAVNGLSEEIDNAVEAVRCYDDGKTDTVDALDLLHAALCDLIDCATDVVAKWEC